VSLPSPQLVSLPPRFYRPPIGATARSILEVDVAASSVMLAPCCLEMSLRAAPSLEAPSLEAPSLEAPSLEAPSLEAKRLPPPSRALPLVLRRMRERELVPAAADRRFQTKRTSAAPTTGRLFYWCFTGRPQPEETHDPFALFPAVDQPFPSRDSSGHCSARSGARQRCSVEHPTARGGAGRALHAGVPPTSGDHESR
jgi:hypothetical protein